MKIPIELKGLFQVSLVTGVLIAALTWGVASTHYRNMAAAIKPDTVYIKSDTVYINNPDAVMDAFVYGWRAGRSAVIRAVNSTGGVVNPDTVHKQIEAAFPQDTALFHLKLKAE